MESSSSTVNKENESCVQDTPRREIYMTRQKTREEIIEKTRELNQAELEYQEKVAQLMEMREAVMEKAPAHVKARFDADLHRLIHAPIVFEDGQRTGPTKFKAELDKLAVKIKQERKEARENAALEQAQLDMLAAQKAQLEADIEGQVARLNRMLL